MAVSYNPNPHPIRIARQKAGLSLSALAALVDMPMSYLCKIEIETQPRIFVDQLVKIAAELGVKDWWRLASEVNKAPSTALAERRQS